MSDSIVSWPNQSGTRREGGHIIHWGLALTSVDWPECGGRHELRRNKWSHLENETAVDDQQSSENVWILSKIDTKVSFKSLCSWPFQSFEIKWAHFYNYNLKVHGEFLYKLAKNDINRTLMASFSELK